MTNIEIILNAMTPTVDRLTERFIENETKRRAIAAEKSGYPARPLTAYDIACYKMDLQIDALKAFGRYILDTDKITVRQIATDQGSITFGIIVTRDGQDFPMTTEMITAGGYNIQCFHLRYISKTDLRVQGKDALAAAMIAKRRRMTIEEKVREEREAITNDFEQNIESTTKKMSITKEQFAADSFHFNADWNRLNDFSKALYKSEEAFRGEQIARFETEWKRHEERYSKKTLNRIHANYKKDMIRLDKKLAKG